MKKKRLVFIVGVFTGVFVLGYLIVNNFLGTRLAALTVTSNKDVTVLVDNKEVGTTPYEGTFNPKEVMVQIGNYATKVVLQKGVRTIVTRDFSDGGLSSGEILSFEKTDLPATVAVVTNPGGARVNVDQKEYGVSPLNIDGLNQGKHQMMLTLEGFEVSSFDINLADGYKLTAYVDLKAKTDDTKSNPVAKISYVKILSTPNGFLRVRSEPNVDAAELGRVHDGEKYQFINKDQKTGWFDIQLSATSSGWISDSFATIEE